MGRKRSQSTAQSWRDRLAKGEKNIEERRVTYGGNETHTVLYGDCIMNRTKRSSMSILART